MSKQRPTAVLLVVSAFVVLLILTLQYPFSTSFPIGGDAAFYVRVARTLLGPAEVSEKITLLIRAPYPAAYVAAAASAVLPLEWPERFTWLVTVTYIGVGGCLGLLLYRLHGAPAAASAMIIWALASIGITEHIEAATFAQLLSLAFLILFFERVAADSIVGIVVTFCAALLSHPLTGLVLLLTTLLVIIPGAGVVRSLPSARRTTYWILFALAMVSVGALVFKLGSNPNVLTNRFMADDNSFSLPDVMRTFFGPFLALTPLGFLYFARQPRENLLLKMLLISFFNVAVLLTFNHYLGVGLWTHRFQSFLVVSVTILSAIALPQLLRTVLPTTLLRGSFAIVFFGSLLLGTWHTNNHVFRYYEAPGNYARLHPGEEEGIRWMRQNLSSQSVVVTSNANRHPEWIPALTGMEWLSLPHLNEEIKINEKLGEARVFGRPVYLAFFLNAEEVPSVFPAAPVIFQNDDFRLIRIRD